MDFEETLVEQDGEQAEDLLPDTLVDDSEESEENIESLTDEEGEEKQSGEEEAPKGTQGTSEPGYVKSRIAKAVEKAIAETEERLTAQFEARMAPLMEQMIETEADRLVRSGKVKDLDTAKELVRYRQGIAAQPAQQETAQPSQANGQFAPKEQQADPATSVRIEMLRHQADRIKAGGGPDVIAEWRKNEDINQKVISGEWDFYDVADYLKKKAGKRPPAPMRSPNGASEYASGSIMSMSDKQFDALVKKVKGGARFRER